MLKTWCLKHITCFAGNSQTLTTKTARHHISSSEQIKIAVSCRSCGAEGAVVLAPGSTVRMHLLLGMSWYLRLVLCPLSLGGASLYKPDTHGNFKVLRKVTFTSIFPSYLILGEPVQHATGVLWLISCSRSAFYVGIPERVWGEWVTSPHSLEFRSCRGELGALLCKDPTVWFVSLQRVLINLTTC